MRRYNRVQMKKNADRTSYIRNLALWMSIVALVFTVVVPQIYRKSETVQAAVRKIVSKPIPVPGYLPMEEPAELPGEVLPEQNQPTGKKPEKTTVAGSNTGSPFAKCSKAECKFNSIVARASKRYQVEPALIKAIIMAESGYNPRAVSNKGAMGLMQLMPVTAAELGVEDVFNPEHNINGGVRYYKKLLKRLNGDVELALAAYNAGIQTVKKYRGVPPYKATRHYIKKVFHYYRLYKKTGALESA